VIGRTYQSISPVIGETRSPSLRDENAQAPHLLNQYATGTLFLQSRHEVLLQHVKINEEIEGP
jgi:hypothetical protein